MIEPPVTSLRGSSDEEQVTVTVTVEPSREVGLVDRNIYGHFLESDFFGNIEGGVFDEGHPLALPGPGALAGLRRDVIDACRALGVPVVRWPGGNFASGYHWEDGIGPRDRRPRRLDLAWIGEESNRFGTDEFLAWCAEVGAEPYLAHGARSVDDAVRWVEYTNYCGRTAYTAARADNGHPDSYGVRYWGIGNEVWGPWQMGHRPASSYAADLREHAWFMRRVDPKLSLVAVGPRTPEDEEWAYELLSKAGELIDYVSFHLYGASLHLSGHDDYDAVVTQARFFEDQIAAYSDLLADVSCRTGLDREVWIALDEWNIRHLEPAGWPAPQPDARGGAALRNPPGGREAAGRLRVNRYSSRTLADALFYAGVFNALHRLAGRPFAVHMANTVNLVNANALLEVRPDGLVRSATYYVWDLYQRHMGRRVVHSEVSGPTALVDVRQGAGDNSPVFDTRQVRLPALDLVATTGANGTVQVAVINRDRNSPVIARIVCSGELCGAARASQLGAGSDDVWATNSLDRPAEVATIDRGVVDLPDGHFSFPPHSVTVLELVR